jgi:hypothetical protein
LDDELEALAAAQGPDSEVAHVASGEAVHADLLHERDDRGVDEIEAEIGVLAIDVRVSVQDRLRGRGVRAPTFTRAATPGRARTRAGCA